MKDRCAVCVKANQTSPAGDMRAVLLGSVCIVFTVVSPHCKRLIVWRLLRHISKHM